MNTETWKSNILPHNVGIELIVARNGDAGSKSDTQAIENLSAGINLKSDT